MMMFNLLKYILLLWVLAPIGLNASDVIFDDVGECYKKKNKNKLFCFQFFTPFIDQLILAWTSLMQIQGFRVAFCFGLFLQLEDLVLT